MRYFNFLFLIFILTFSSCRPKNPVPKPVGYFKVDLPEHAYQEFDSVSFPFSFSYPVYAEITQDSSLAKKEKAPYWINVFFPKMNATIFLSYKTIDKATSLDDLIEESYRLSYAHDIRADYIKSPPFETGNGLYGVFFNVGGDAASSYQFFITDTVKNFVRGALYFNVSPNADSLKPASDFLRADIDHLIETFRFK